jgi:Fe-S cluster assembly protein SufD
MENVENHLRNFRALAPAGPSALRRRRATAIERFAELGFPTTHLEEWKFTDVTALARTPFRLSAEPVAPPARLVEESRLAGCVELVFVNGRYAPELSHIAELPTGATVSDLAAALAADPDAVLAAFGSVTSPNDAPFTALNTAFAEHGAFIRLAKGTALETPIHLLFIAVAAAEPIIVHPRVLVVADESSQASVFETYVGSGGGAYCTNAVTEIVLGPNASIAHHKLEVEGASAFHVATIGARQEKDSRFSSHSATLGAAFVRSEVATALDGPGASCSLDGLYLTAAAQHADHQTTIDHREPHCTSRELYKGVLDGKSSAVFNGKVFVRENAQKSDAGQVNKNLLLSRDALVDTKPQLEIFADDVKCSHGATIGRLDADALFFLRSRGIGPTQARQLLIQAFANELVERIAFEPARARLEKAVASRLRAGGELA